MGLKAAYVGQYEIAYAIREGTLPLNTRCSTPARALVYTTFKWKKHETSYLEHKWTRDEVAAFEDGILVHGAELRAIFEEMGTRTMPEVVRFYGHWKKYALLLSLFATYCNLNDLVPIVRNFPRKIVVSSRRGLHPKDP